MNIFGLSFLWLAAEDEDGWWLAAVDWFAWGNGLVVSTPTVVAGSIPAFSTCLFHVVPRVPGGAADEKTGPVVPYGRIKPVLIVSIYLVGPSPIIG